MSTQVINPLAAQLTHRPFPEVAEVLLAAAAAITLEWDAVVRQAMPQMRGLTFDELKDSTPQILLAIAHALASDDPDVIRELINRAPSQGLSRFRLNFDVVEVMQEDRLLRAITVQHVEEGLGRRMDVPESAALHAAIDIMLQRSVIALVDQQKSQLRAAAEKELKFLSFLSHDLNNNLNSVTMTLEALSTDLSKAGGFTNAEESLGFAQQCIHDTVAGMRSMLDHERVRQSGQVLKFSPVNLRALAAKVTAQFSREAQAKGLRIAIEMPADCVVESNSELLSLVLQNVVGNGVKYATGGVVRVGFGASDEGRPMLWVSDEGPGIAPEQKEHIFEAFRRGDVGGEPGLGLGLAIALQAAKLLGASLTLESEVDLGSTFRLVLPDDTSYAGEILKRTELPPACLLG
jgi:signal transduction histidine kinase